MAAELVKGAPVSARVREQVAAALAKAGVRPCLANVAIGADGASLAYLDAIDRACAKAGIDSRRVVLPAVASQAEAEAAIAKLAEDRAVHGLMLQFPLPRELDATRLAALVPVEKDVDGVARASLGAVLAGERRHAAPCTAAAVVELLASDPRLSPEGREVCVIGRSLVVGRPLAAMLAAQGPGGNATVTLCHSKTRDLAAHARRADIVVVAAGVRGLLKPDMVRPGAVVIDVGTHPVEGPSGPTLAGDAEPAVAEVAGCFTPVPGGVGPVTNAILLRHVTAAAAPGYLPAAW
jgi:methylenetetrahydrofolate dehydrogenase (NADP+) / methenyltetrahydrofolate cyclohydrolase